ncbi:MAG: FAD-binding oxidoreductase [Salibacteraceae bacterium]
MTLSSSVQFQGNLLGALAAWESLLGARGVIKDTASVTKAEQTTFACRNAIQALIYPETTQQVQECLQIANTFSIPVYPVSQGKNWGLGSRVPVQSGAVVMDLSRMTGITDFSEEMAYVTVEPGVTFQQLFEYLQAKQSGLMMDSIATTPYASIIGNTMERGQGMGPLADRFSHVSGMTVILPQGELVKTGFAGYRDSSLGPLAKWGVGAYVDGLFTQSNLGIVTELTLWLRPKPKVFQSFMAYLEADADLGPFTDAMRTLRLNGLDLSIRIFDDYRLMSTTLQYPYLEVGNERPLPQNVREQFRERLGGLGKWIALGGLYSRSAAMASLEAEEVRQAFAPHALKFVVFNEDTIAQQDFDGLSFQAPQLNTLYYQSMLRGFPSEMTLKMAYWRKRHPAPELLQPLEDRCGLIWYCPALPCRGSDIRAAAGLIEQTCHAYGFETNVGFLMLTERTVVIIGGIVYDRDESGEDEKAMACHDALIEAFIERGWSPYRLGVPSMKWMNLADSGFLQMLSRIKSELDPNNVLAPGRYQKS